MSCIGPILPICTDYINVYFKGVAPGLDITGICCTGNGDIYTITGRNNTDLHGSAACPGGWAITIDGTGPFSVFPGCTGLLGQPCINNDFGGTIQILSYTLGAIPVGSDFQIVVQLNRNNCDCFSGQTTLRIYPNVALPSANCDDVPCCMIEIPIVIDLQDDAPFTINSGPLSLLTCPGTCVSQAFNITNDSCIDRKYHVELNPSCSSHLTINPAVIDFILTPGQTSSPITVEYCPIVGVIETGICSVDITTIANGQEPGCDQLQSLVVSYNTTCMWACCDGVCVPDPNGLYDTQAECQASCNQTPFQPTANICSDCYNAVKLNGVRVDSTPCKTTCSRVGDVLDILVNVSMPVREFSIVQVDQVSSIFFILGDWTSGFLAGATFFVSSSTCNNGLYIVVNSVFDGTYTQIFVTAAIPCTTADGIITISANSCSPSVVLNVVNTDTGLVLYNFAYPVSPGGFVYESVNLILTDYGTHEITITACDCFGCVVCTYILDTCAQFKICKNACYDYTIIDYDVTTPKINTITITNLDGSYTMVYTMDTSITTQLSIVLPADGIYTVTITNNLTDDEAVYNIVELCALNECFKSLILEIMCNEKDPCCKECDDMTLRKQAALRFEMNKIVALYFMLQALLKRHYIDFTGVFIGDSCSSQDLKDINNAFMTLNELTRRCGKCQQSVSPSVKPCTNC